MNTNMEESKNNTQEGAKGVVSGKTCVCGTPCACGCGCGWAHGHRAFRVILGIVILLVVFWIGVKVGEVKMALELNSGYGIQGGYSNEYQPVNQMMNRNGGGFQQQGPGPAASATGTTSAPAQQ